MRPTLSLVLSTVPLLLASACLVGGEGDAPPQSATNPSPAPTPQPDPTGPGSDAGSGSGSGSADPTDNGPPMPTKMPSISYQDQCGGVTPFMRRLTRRRRQCVRRVRG